MNSTESDKEHIQKPRQINLSNIQQTDYSKDFQQKTWQ